MKPLSLLSRAALALGAFLLVGSAALRAADNQLTAAEKAAGWKLLFDGKTLNGWRHFLGKDISPEVWRVENGEIHALKGTHTAEERAKDIITEKKYLDYELSWEWKISPKGNNGVKYLVTEARPKTPGPEYQMMDDYAQRTKSKRLGGTAAFYEVIPPADDAPLRPAGEWNQSRIVLKGNHIEHWLNGKNVMTAELGSPEVKAGIAKSKFKDEPGYGDKIEGHIMLTFHGDECWFKNIKIREIK